MTPQEAIEYLRKEAALRRRVFNGMCRSDQPELFRAEQFEKIAELIAAMNAEPESFEGFEFRSSLFFGEHYNHKLGFVRKRGLLWEGFVSESGETRYFVFLDNAGCAK